MQIQTSTPGFSVEIRARTTPPDPSATDTGGNNDGWTQLAYGNSVGPKQSIPLQTAGTRYRYYLVWITKLPPGKQSVELNEITLFR